MRGLTASEASNLFEYRDGILYWKVSRGKVMAGDIAGNLNKAMGRMYVGVNKKLVLLHRVVFLMHHGYLPNMVDHIDGNPLNNRIENLRPATRSENNQNRKTNKNTVSGIKGVDWHKQVGKWRVQVRVAGKKKHFGLYAHKEIAETIAMMARHKHHGEFARHA